MAEYALEMNFFRRETLVNNDLNQVADQQFSLQQWFAVGVQSAGLQNLVLLFVIKGLPFQNWAAESI